MEDDSETFFIQGGENTDKQSVKHAHELIENADTFMIYADNHDTKKRVVEFGGLWSLKDFEICHEYVTKSLMRAVEMWNGENSE